MSEKPTYEELIRKLQEYEAVIQDLGKLRKAEAALQNSEKKYRRLVESLERDYITLQP